jgi:two-component system, response regulator / RNA-binding antiterminator
MRVLVVAESAQRAETLRAGLRIAGHELVELVSLSSALEPALAHARAELLMLEADAPASDLVDRILDAMGDSVIPLAIFADHPSHEAIEHSVRAGVAAYVVGPVEATRIPAIIDLTVARFDYLNDLRNELGAAQQKLAERKFVERAKGLLMKARNLSEDEAYHTLRRMAMERNRRMGEVARSVIEMAELLN